MAYYINPDEIEKVESGIAEGTPILTKDGYVPIEKFEGKTVKTWNGDEWVENFEVKTVETWNGDEWVEYSVEKAPEEKTVRKVNFSNGSELWVEPNFIFVASNGEEVTLHSIRNNEQLLNPSRMPLAHSNLALNKQAYHGFDVKIQNTLDSKVAPVYYLVPTDDKKPAYAVLNSVLTSSFGGKYSY